MNIKQRNRELIERIREGDKDSLEELLIINTGLVSSIAKRFEDFEREDAIQEGYIGLMRAVEKFEQDKGEFQNYAVFWIYRFIFSAYCKNLPITYPENVYKVVCQRKNDKLNPDDFSPRQLEEIDKWVRQLETFQISKVSESELPSYEPDFLRTELKQYVDRLLDVLTERERQVIEMRYGFDGREMTLEEVGKAFGVTRERIRQIESRALRKMRFLAQQMNIQDF